MQSSTVPFSNHTHGTFCVNPVGGWTVQLRGVPDAVFVYCLLHQQAPPTNDNPSSSSPIVSCALIRSLFEGPLIQVYEIQ